MAKLGFKIPSDCLELEECGDREKERGREWGSDVLG
jgi:hypothetical protein